MTRQSLESEMDTEIYKWLLAARARGVLDERSGTGDNKALINDLRQEAHTALLKTVDRYVEEVLNKLENALPPEIDYIEAIGFALKKKDDNLEHFDKGYNKYRQYALREIAALRQQVKGGES